MRRAGVLRLPQRRQHRLGEGVADDGDGGDPSRGDQAPEGVRVEVLVAERDRRYPPGSGG